MSRSGRLIGSCLVLAAIAIAGCKSWQATPQRSTVLVQVSVRVEVEACLGLGGCVGYVSLAPKGSASVPEVRIVDLAVGPSRSVGGLPSELAPGTWTVRARSVALADEFEPGGQRAELPIGACQDDVQAPPDHGQLGSQIDILVVFTADGCRLSETMREVVAAGPSTQPTSSSPT